MIKIHVAVPASILLLSFSIPSAAQSFGNTSSRTAPREALQTPSDPSVITVRPELTDEQLADLYMAHKEYREAAQTFKRLTDENPRNPVYLNKLGIALHQQAALDMALKYYERATKVDPMYADAQNNIGTIWYQRKKYGKAIKSYQKAIAIRKDMAVLYSNLGYAYFSDKKFAEAMAAFRQTLVLDPQFFEHNGGRNGSVLQDRSVTNRGQFYFMLAKSFAQVRNLERCVIYLRKAKDEGYASMNSVKSDPDFAAMLASPAIQEILAPKQSEMVRR